MNAQEIFRGVLRDAGLDYAGPIEADGELHRFKAEGDHARNSWYVLHPSTPAAGAFGCWKRGLSKTWCDNTSSLTAAQWHGVRERWQEAERERERMEEGRRTKARATAEWILNRSRPLRTLHRYLARKGVQIFGDLREWRGDLVLPLRDASGGLHSLQFISADGSKRFLTGGRISGCMFILGDRPEGALVICEGYATGASNQEATGFAVVCTMSAGNVLAVAACLHEKYPGRDIVIAADNDQFTAGNPGITKATEAAIMICAKLAAPQFSDVTAKPTDFNDLHQMAGLHEVARQIQGAVQLMRVSPMVEPPVAPPENSKPAIASPDGDAADSAPAPFPTECLPPDIADMVRAVAAAQRVPEALPALMALALVAGSCGKGAVLDWRPGKSPTPANLFVVVSALSGSGKSECAKLLAKVFHDFERAMQENWRKVVQPKLHADLRFHEVQLKKLDRKLAKDSTTADEADRYRGEMAFHQAKVQELEAQLHEPQLSAQDATVEKLATILFHNDEATFSMSPDARKLCDNLLGRYSASKKLADDGIYLSAFSGDDVKVDRQGRDSLRLGNPCMTLLWALQPDALQMLLDEDSLQQGGWLARCLIAHTHAEPQHIGGDTSAIPLDARARWERLIRRLLVTYRQPPTLPASATATMDEEF